MGKSVTKARRRVGAVRGKSEVEKSIDERKASSLKHWALRHPQKAKEQRALRVEAAKAQTDFDHKREGTIETHAKAAAVRQGALARLFESGAIDADQLAWACEIAEVAELYGRDVEVRTASLETRVDQSLRGVALVEGIRRVRMQMAYTRWRVMLPTPKRLVLDMICGDAIGYTLAARRFGVHNRKAKRLLIQAIDRWPECLEWAQLMVSREELDLINARLA